MFKNRVLWKIQAHVGAVRGDWDWRKLHDEELHDLYSAYSSADVIGIRWEGHVAYMRGGEMHSEFCWQDHFENLGIHGRVTLKQILKKQNGRASLRTGTGKLM